MKNELISITETEDIEIRAIAQFIPEESEPEQRRYFFAYQITIRNVGVRPAKLLNRFWKIINSDGEQRIVEGSGVVGKQPYLRPGEQFQYVSGCPLDTEWGTMEGHFQFIRDDGQLFKASIKRFYLTHTEIETILM
jgi:ApaG protein